MIKCASRGSAKKKNPAAICRGASLKLLFAFQTQSNRRRRHHSKPLLTLLLSPLLLLSSLLLLVHEGSRYILLLFTSHSSTPLITRCLRV